MQTNLINLIHSFFSSRLFEVTPGAIALFPKFADVPPEEREENEDYKDHALRVVEAIGLAISMLDDEAAVKDVLVDLGTVHCKHSVQDPHFDVSLSRSSTQQILLLALFSTACWRSTNVDARRRAREYVHPRCGRSLDPPL